MRLFARIFAWGRRRLSARVYFIVLSAGLIIPTLLISWRLADMTAASQQAEIEEHILHQAGALSDLFEWDVIAAHKVLVALANSPNLQNKDFESFHRQALKVAQSINTQIVLTDRGTMKQTINTSLPWGADLTGGLPAPLSEGDEAKLRAREPFVSNIFWGALVRHYVAAVILPVAIDGSLYFLSIGIPAERFSEIIRHAIPTDLSASVVDRNGIVVARSERSDEFVGKPIRGGPDQPDLRSSRSITVRLGLDGIRYHSGYVRSDATGWTAFVGIPESALQASSNRVRMEFSAAGAAILLIALILAYQFGGSFPGSYGALGIDRKPSREEFQILFEHAPNGVAVVDAQGAIALLNEQMESMFGFSRGELVGKPVETLIPERLRAMHLDLRAAYLADARARPMGSGRELFGLRRDGSEFPIEIGLNPIRIPAGDLVMATVVDITKRTRAAASLSAALAERDELRRRFLQAQEDERLRLAHELHDQTGQILTALMLELKDIENISDRPDRDRLRAVRQQMEQMGKALHQVAYELRPASLDELGLASALANYAAEWSEQYGIECDFHCAEPNLDDLPDGIRTTVYRVLQEGLTNIAKHARTATSVGVVIDCTGSILMLTIDDNGTGFDATKISGSSGARSGLGLPGMRERLALVGGELTIESSDEAGTTIFARIRLPTSGLAA